MVPVIRDAGRKNFAGFKAAFDELIEKARTNTLTADDLTGANISLTNPGGIGTIASVPRLMVGQGTIVATGSIAYPPGLQNIGDMIGAEKVMTMTSTYDHRVIQGAESGRFLQVVEAYLQGDQRLLRRRLRLAGRRARPAARAAGAGRGGGRRPRCRAGRPARRGRDRRAHAAGRAGGHLAAEGPPHPRPPRGAPGPAGHRARGRSGARADDRRPLPRGHGQDPGQDPAHARARGDPGRRAAAPARDLLRHDRLRDRAHRQPPPAHVAAREDRGSASSASR